MRSRSSAFLILTAVGVLASATDATRAVPVAGPREVIMVRNAEEPPGSDVHLSAEGMARAKALARWIPATFGQPDALFASTPTKNSRRAIETLEPLAAALKLKIQDNFANEDFAKMVATVMADGAYTGKLVVIAWQRGNLPNIAKAFGAKEPPAWPAGQYDHLWRLKFTGTAVTLEDLVQKFSPTP
jgi:broad specificity phosphatase PhoE